jgi:hypothetical protein
MFNANLQKQRHQLSLKFYFYKTHIKERSLVGVGEKDSTGMQCQIKAERPQHRHMKRPGPVKDLKRKMLFAEKPLDSHLDCAFLDSVNNTTPDKSTMEE